MQWIGRHSLVHDLQEQARGPVGSHPVTASNLTVTIRHIQNGLVSEPGSAVTQTSERTPPSHG